MKIKETVVKSAIAARQFVSEKSNRAIPALRSVIFASGRWCVSYLRQAAGSAFEGLLGFVLNGTAWLSFQSLISGLISPLGLAPLATNLTAAVLAAVAVWQVRRFLTGLFRLSVKLIRKLFR
ncbi:TPA: hypothetical protein ACOXWE_004588 [Salmonella enterica]